MCIKSASSFLRTITNKKKATHDLGIIYAEILLLNKDIYHRNGEYHENTMAWTFML